MYARISTMKLQDGKLDRGIAVLDSIDRLLKLERVKGYTGAWVFIKRQKNTAVVQTRWETEADLLAFEHSALHQKMVGLLAGLIEGEPVVERIEVADIEEEPVTDGLITLSQIG